MIKKIAPFVFVLMAGMSAMQCSNINPPSKAQARKMAESASASSDAGHNLPLAAIKLPPGFKIDVFATGVKNARSMALSPTGTLFVGTRDQGDVYAVKDNNGDYKADQVFVLATGLNMPNGVAFRNGDLYVAEVNRILKFKNIEDQLANPPAPEVVYDKYPTDTHHGWKYIAFGPDGKLYVPVGAPCNICESKNKIYASITRINPDGTGLEIVQEGIRNTVGFAWHPDNKQLWFTDNGRDMMGDDMPSCELNHATADRQHFGYPYCHQGDTPDPEFGHKRPCSDFVAPAQKVGPHVAPLGVEFYTGQQFPTTYQKQLFVAEHGSWNRSKKSGYKLSLATIQNDKVVKYEPFAEGWLNKEKDEAWGRPVDVELLPDGSMLLSDDFADVIYRISYQKP